MFLSLLKWYVIVGVINLAIIDFFTNKVSEIRGTAGLSNLERVVILCGWPVFSTIFWYNFIKSFTKKDD
jgi:hypothetical protein